MGLTEAQLEERRHYLGGTDMARLAGVSRYGGPLQVWLEKTGQTKGKPATSMMAMGTLLEPVVATLFSTATGMLLRRPAERALRDRLRPWLGGNIDRYANPAPQGDQPAGIFEAKWSQTKTDWGDTHPTPDGQAKIPPGYAVQVQHYLGLTGRPVAYVGVLLGYADFRWYAVPADPDTIAALRELGTRFWRDNVVTGIPPEPDGTDDYSAWLRDRYPATDSEAVATGEQRAWADAWLAADQQVREATVARETAAQNLQKSMRGVTRLLLPQGHVTWKPYDENRVSWAAVADVLRDYLAEALQSNDEADDLYAQAAASHLTTTTKRPFKPHLTDEEE